MVWFKVDDHLHSHSKAMRAGTEAMGLWVLAGSWCSAEESDGWVPEYVLPRLVGADGVSLAERLVKAGLWYAGSNGDESGFWFHAWGEYQPTKDSLEERRAAQRERMRRVRSQGGSVRTHNKSTTDTQSVHDASSDESVTPTPTRPDPTRPTNTPPVASADFEEFWDTYPNKKGKKAAETKYRAARKSGATHAAIMDGLKAQITRWRLDRTEVRFIPHPTTWLNQGRWEDHVTDAPLFPDDDTPTAIPMTTARQCGNPETHERHKWTHGSNNHVCLGENATHNPANPWATA